MLEASYIKSSPFAGVTSSPTQRDREHDETYWRLTSGGDCGGLNAMICAVALRAARPMPGTSRCCGRRAAWGSASAMPDAEPSPGEAFWRFSLTFYALPRVAPALLALQDLEGLDVNLMLFALWLGISGRHPLDSGALAVA